MQILKEIRQVDSEQIQITIPKEYRNSRVEIVVSLIDESGPQDALLQKRLRAADELNGLISDQNED